MTNKEKEQVVVSYPVYFNIEDAMKTTRQKMLFKKLKRKAATHPEIAELRIAIKEFADHLFPISTIKPHISSSDLDILLD